MDVDVEMVDSRRREFAEADDGEDAEDVAGNDVRPSYYNKDIVDNPSVRRQNICFLFAMFTLVLAFSVYVVGRVYMFSSPDDGFFGDLGTHTGQVDDHDKITKISAANDKYSKSHGKGWTQHHKKDPQPSNNHPPPSSESGPEENVHPENPTTTTSTPPNSDTEEKDKEEEENEKQENRNPVPETENNDSGGSTNPPEPEQPPPADSETNTNSIEHSDSTLDDDRIQSWLNADVTLKDGKMYEIVARLDHGKTAFTEGLCFVNGRLFESTGMKRQSVLQELNPDTGEIMDQWPMDENDFGEGLTYVDGYFIQLTWQHKKAYKYDFNDLLAPPQILNFTSHSGQGWGLTYDAAKHELIESDGSHFLNIWDPDTLAPLRQVPVYRLDGVTKADQLNELEMWRGKVLANVWYWDIILVINPETGRVEKEYDFSDLWDEKERNKAGANVLNGISISDEEDILYITGKNWDRMFKVRLLP